jgi:hypothetical protein
MPDMVAAAKEQAEKLADLQREAGKRIVCVTRTPTSATGMEATLAFQEIAGERGLATFNSVATASLALVRLMSWQRNREPAFTPAK